MKKDKLRENFEQTEKVLLVILFVSVLFNQLLSGFFSIFQSLTLIMIALFYFFITDKGSLLSKVTLILYPAGLIIKAIGWFIPADFAGWFLTAGNILTALPYLIFGVYIVYLSIKFSQVNKTFEMLTFLLGAFLLVQAVLFFIAGDLEEMVAVFVFPFALAFVIATIMYNDNLWERYNFDQKNVIKFFLFYDLVLIFNSSLEKISL